ncbi:DNA polymerase I [Conexibacter woesei]|uniref:DNA polymerase I n=1 Tax=Conexibacter woesei TaxID=191495 RepID=UPI0004045242|nr:DNA polymerase I [Conexibacter woesei]
MAANGTHEELYLIDGSSLAYRAFFALPESIATSTGFPTNTIFGFASMLVKLLTEHGQKPTIVVWDAGHSGRKEISSEYKATRQSRPDLLKEQWPHLGPLVEAFGYKNVSVPGYEADDVIASIAEKARNQDVPVIVVTGDRDIFQLIDPDSKVRVMATGRGITDTKLYDYQAVIDRYGLPPESIPDFYGLKGDTSDNIPGVPGIGDKTAAQLLDKYKDLETVLASVDEISGAKRRENLVNHADDARISKQLATIMRDIPVDVDPAAEAAAEPDRSKLREVFREFELRAPLARLEEALAADDQAGVPAAMPAEPENVRVRAREGGVGEVRALAQRSDDAEVALALIAPEIPEGQLLAEEPVWRFGACVGEEAIVGTLDDPQELIAALGDRPVIAHDAKAWGVVPQNLTHDTLLAAYLLEPARRGFPFAELCEERGFKVESDQPLAAEAALLQALTGWQREQLDDRGLTGLLDEVELPLVAVLRDMEVEGVRLNKERLAEIRVRVQDEIAGLEREIFELTGEQFTIGSPQQLGVVLFEKLGLSRKRRGKTGFSTDARVLQAIRDEHPVVPKIERWRELNQLMKTYLDVLPQVADEESRIHTTFVQAAATTGRLASTNPNLQNVPVRTELGREIRGCFEAAPGNVLISADYSQVELRVMAFIADEPVLKDIFVRGEDVHTATASQVFGRPAEELTPMDRSKAKMINYGIVYGLSDYGLADRLNIPREEAKAFIDAYLERFGRVAAFMATTIEEAKERGFVTTLFGRRRQLPELRARNYQVRTLGERLAVNTVIQGTAADVMKLAMIGVHRELKRSGLRTRMILTIHDELLFEGPPEEAEQVKALVEREMLAPWGDRTPPLDVDAGVGVTWLEAK